MPFTEHTFTKYPTRSLAAVIMFGALFLFATEVGIAQQGEITNSTQAAIPTTVLDLDSLDPEQVRTEAEAGSAEAQYQLGMLYRMGSEKLKFRKNRTEATVWFRKAAEQGNFEADVELAKIRMTRYPKAEPINWQKIITHWEKEGNEGSHEAQSNLGVCYADGIGVEADGAKSIHWCTMAVESDPKNHQPMFTLAKLYRDGEIVPTNTPLAFEWMQKAANTGYNWAQLRLAEMYADGIGTDQDYAEAAKWAEKANKSGIGKDAQTAKERYQHLAKRPKATKFEITVAGNSVTVTRIGTGPIGVIFFGHTGVSKMNQYLLDNFEWLESLTTEKCTYFLWEYPESAPFDQIIPTLDAYRAGDHTVKLAFPGIAAVVVSQIAKESGLNQYLVIGNSLGAGMILWDYPQLVENQSLSFLLLSPTEAFMPEPSQIPQLERTTLLGAKGWKNNEHQMRTDMWLSGAQAWDWVAANRNDVWGDLITESRASEPVEKGTLESGARFRKSLPTDFSIGHKTIGNDINCELLDKLIRVQLGIADKQILAEPPQQR